jgi:hypothetical protein
MIFANWRGFSGGQRDMFDEVLKFGSMIVVCNYCCYCSVIVIVDVAIVIIVIIVTVDVIFAFVASSS